MTEALKKLPTSAVTGVYDAAPLAPTISVDVAPALGPFHHFHDSADTEPSGSVSDAVSGWPSCTVPPIATTPGSLALVTVMVSVSVASAVVSGMPEASLPSVT